MLIRPFELEDQPAVVDLWRRCGLTRPWNAKDIARKLAVQPELFLVGVEDGVIVAVAMAGYDGHRAVSTILPSTRRRMAADLAAG